MNDNSPAEEQSPDVVRLNDGPVVSDGTSPLPKHVLPFPVVGIGGSAGGVEASIQLFENLPASTGMAFVVISHLSSHQKSYLPDIIGRCTTMETITVEEGLQPVPNRVYFLPPNSKVTLREGRFRLEPRVEDGQQFRPIDYFFRSLSTEQRSHAVGVVLSGMDADGALGLRAIKAEGGIAIAQLPESARFPDMPKSSISADHVDWVLPPAQIGIHLGELASRFDRAEVRTLEEDERGPEEESRVFARMFKLLKGVSGIDFRLYKPATIRRRIARRMLLQHRETLGEYAALLQNNGHELRELQEDLLINVTRFFRDPDVFDALKSLVFTRILRDRSPDEQLRIWVAGCATGEEVYSIAIALLESLQGNGLEPPIQIFGTDASERCIYRARQAIYPESITNEVSAERIRSFFGKVEKGYQVSKRIRDLCVFARQNLVTDPPFSRLDLISCRNVLIYFGAPLQRQLIPAFHYALRPEGYLLLGSSETIREFNDLFVFADRQHKIYSKIGITPARALLDVGSRAYTPDLIPEVMKLHSRVNWLAREIQRRADQLVLAQYGPPGVVVSETLQIVQTRGNLSPFLELPTGALSLQLGTAARDTIAAQLVAAVRKAIDLELPVRIERISVHEGQQLSEATVEVLPMQSVAERTRYYLVLFVPLAPAAEDAMETEGSLVANPATRDRELLRLQHDLTSTRLYLRSLLEERDARNQELVSANEEIQSANEELQSTNEELETTKEELQSSNEELQTVNDELQNRNVVLTQTSNDLSNLLNSVNMPVLMLSNDLSIRHFTPQTQRLMNLRSTDVGRPFGDIRLNLSIDNLEPLFTEVLETLVAREVEVRDREGHWFLLRIRPYRTTENKIDGLVVVLVDVDQIRRTQQDLRNARDFARSVIENVPLPLVVVDTQFRVQATNGAFCTIANLPFESIQGRNLPDFMLFLWGIDQPLRSMLERLREQPGPPARFEFEQRSSEKDPREFRIAGRVLRPDGENFLLITFQDITAPKEAERHLKMEGERLATEVEATTRELQRSREELQALTGSLLNSQEIERRRLARDLHDDVSQRLAAITFTTDQALQAMGDAAQDARTRLRNAISLASDLADDVRAMSHRLHPAIIEDLGLAQALEALTEEFGERENMIATFSLQNVPEKIPLEIATSLYRMAQEALRNVTKHAGKTHVKVRLSGGEGSLEMQVIDAGRGFDTTVRHAGLGLISMQERARLIGATLDIQSVPNEGTRVTVFVPRDRELAGVGGSPDLGGGGPA